MSTAITDSLGQYIAAKILKQPKRVVREDEALISSGLINSFSLVDLALYVEDQFGVHLDNSELNASHLRHAGQLDSLIQQRQA